MQAPLSVGFLIQGALHSQNPKARETAPHDWTSNAPLSVDKVASAAARSIVFPAPEKTCAYVREVEVCQQASASVPGVVPAPVVCLPNM